MFNKRSRSHPDQRGHIKVLQFSLGAIFEGCPKNDHLLQAKDQIIVFERQVKSLKDDADADMEEIQQADGVARVNLNASSINELKGQNDESQRDPELMQPIIDKLVLQSASGLPIQIVSISGAVKMPGYYPLTDKATVADLIAAAGGLKESAFLGKAEISRTIFDGGDTAGTENLSFNVAQALRGDAGNNVVLQSKDRLMIRDLPDYGLDRRVELKGEVKFPGSYPLKRGETLLDLIERAGGFTEYAHVKATILTRDSVKMREAQQARDLAETLRKEMAVKRLSETNIPGSSSNVNASAGSQWSYDEVQKLLEDLANVQVAGRLVVDVDGLMKGKQSQNVLLENQDTIYVPAFRNTINVVGEVQLSTTHLYEEGMTVDDYLKRSGGLKRQADEDRIYVVKANGSVRVQERGSFWFSEGRDSLTLEPGDTIVVPLDLYYMTGLNLWTGVTNILYNSAITLAAIGNLIN